MNWKFWKKAGAAKKKTVMVQKYDGSWKQCEVLPSQSGGFAKVYEYGGGELYHLRPGGRIESNSSYVKEWLPATGWTDAEMEWFEKARAAK